MRRCGCHNARQLALPFALHSSHWRPPSWPSSRRCSRLRSSSSRCCWQPCSTPQSPADRLHVSGLGETVATLALCNATGANLIHSGVANCFGGGIDSHGPAVAREALGSLVCARRPCLSDIDYVPHVLVGWAGRGQRNKVVGVDVSAIGDGEVAKKSKSGGVQVAGPAT